MAVKLFILILLYSINLNAQREIHFNPNKNEIGNIGSAFENKDNLTVKITITDLNDFYSKISNDTQKDWLEKAKATKKKLSKPSPYKNFLSAYLSMDIASYCKELDKWITYLSDTNYRVSCPGSNYFPCLPTRKDFTDQANTRFQSEVKGYQGSLNLNNPIPLNDASPVIINDGNAHIDITILFKDIMKENLTNYYNQSLSGTTLTTIDPDDLQQWMQELSQHVETYTTILINQLKDTTSYADSTCDLLRPVFDNGKDFQNWLDNQINTSLVVKEIKDSKNTDFFKKWLWYNNGTLSFNPFPFTTKESFRTTIKPDTTKAKAFDSLIALKLGCDVCKTSADSLEYLLQQQKTGDKRFSNEAKIEKEKADNETAYNTFLKGNKLLYSISCPYRIKGEKMPVVHEYNVTKNFSRLDEGFSKFGKKIITANNSIDIDRKPIIAVYNLPATGAINFSSVNKDTLFTSNATKNLGEIADAALTAYAALNPVAATISTLVGKINGVNQMVKLNIPANKSIQASAPKPSLPIKAFQMLYGQPKDVASLRKEFFTVNILDTIVQFDENCKTDRGDTVVKLIYKRLAVQSSVHCTDDIIKAFVSTYPCCLDLDDDKLKRCFEDLLQKMKQDLQTQVEVIAKRKIELLNDIKSTLNSSLFNNIAAIQNLQVPPPAITLDFNKVDTSKDYASTKLFYPTQPEENKSSSRNDYTLKGSKLPYDTTVTGHFNMKKKHWYEVGAGILGTTNNLAVTKVSSANPLTFSRDNNAFRFTAGLHIYPLRILDIDNRFFIHRHYGESTWSRFSLYLGVGIPKPLENFYSGLSVDLVPGLRVHTGARWAWYTKYQVLNNQISDQKSGLKYGGYYIGINIDPVSLVKVLNIFGSNN